MTNRNIEDLRQRSLQNISSGINSNIEDVNNKFEQNAVPTIIEGFSDNEALYMDDLFIQLDREVQNRLLDFAEGSDLETLASQYGITRNSASQSSGSVMVKGIVGTDIPLNTILTSQTGIDYKVVNSATVIQATQNIQSIDRVGNTAYVLTSQPHNLTTGYIIDSIDGYVQGEYNQTGIEITAIGEYSFTYEVLGEPLTPAQPTASNGTFTYTGGLVTVKSEDFGSNTNLPFNSTLTIDLTDIESTSYITYNDIRGGVDLENDESLKQRAVFKRANNANDASYIGMISRLKNTFPYISKVYIKRGARIENNQPVDSAGSFIVYFTIQSESGDRLPNSTQINEVKAELLKPDFMPITYDTNNTYVSAVGEFLVNFEIAISPNNLETRNAVLRSLKSFFQNTDTFELNILQRDYNDILYNTFDQAGNRLQDFNIILPANGSDVTDGKIARLNPNIVFTSL
jgi:uncharacterized phage protein gp47/JayE